MENKRSSFLEEEPILFYSTASNFGVISKNLKTPKNIHMSFTPSSSNEKISFSNTIMFPNITAEETLEAEKNIQNEKSKYSIRKESTRLKTESSKDERNNISCEKQYTKIMNENNNVNDDIDIIVENKSEFNLTSVENSGQKIETNPYFTGGKNYYDVNKFQNLNFLYKKKNSAIFDGNEDGEKKKINQLLNENKNNNDNIESLHKTCKNLRKKSSERNKNKLNNKIKRTKSLMNDKIKKEIAEKEEQERKVRKNKTRYRTSIILEKDEIKMESTNHNQKNSEKNFIDKNNRGKSFRTRKRKRGSTVIMDKIPNYKIKDKNIKIYDANLFNKNSSSKLRPKEPIVITKDKKDEKEKNIKERKRIIKYNGLSHKSLKFAYHIETPKDKKEEEIFKRKKDKNDNNSMREPHLKEKEYNHDTDKKKINFSLFNNNKVKKVKTLPKESNTSEKKKVQNSLKKKMSEATKKIDFDTELKNKNNLCKTQFNLFSPDKFTNTEFCDSDYCEYTLECMNLILSRDKSEKQQKSKVNFNFPKSKSNKLKKKIALFDLDETLVHCTGDINSKKEAYQHCVQVVLPGGTETKVGINLRPFWKKTLNLIRKKYHIVVFTASHQVYADAVLNFMDPLNKYFKYRLYRNNCSFVVIDGVQFYVKDLDIFDEFYDLKDIIIIDNSVLSFIYHLDNGIPIVPYYNEDKDGSLYVVGLYLMHIFKEDDLREANKKYINLNSFLAEAKLRQDKENEINEEPDENINEIIKGTNIKKEDEVNINNMTNTQEIKTNKHNKGNKKDQSRYSLSKDGTPNHLINSSRLMTMYYEINNKNNSDKQMNEISEEKSNKSYSTDEEKEIKNRESAKSIEDIFFKKRMLTTDNKSISVRFNSLSNKSLRNTFNLKMIRSNFYNRFSEKGFFIK